MTLYAEGVSQGKGSRRRFKIGNNVQRFGEKRERCVEGTEQCIGVGAN